MHWKMPQPLFLKLIIVFFKLTPPSDKGVRGGGGINNVINNRVSNFISNLNNVGRI
ncbi:hypothetical protein BN1221_03863 [Brenneria goodwinii]|uniref:Uncharacterized protein n=1 Tax=Brenneria goodwinii TaxID=1109412 RepID=A0A0G4JZS7_9GAMM|nr:hypothetical protein BN1221_03863 [Brenneria goodwinii]